MRKILFTFLLIISANPARAQYGFPSFADLAEKLIPTVVNISTIQQPETIGLKTPDNQDYYSPNEGRQALGSGFIINEQGYIITNYHVIENAQSINVVLFDNTEVDAYIVGVDEKTDIALIKIEPPFELDVVKFGNSDNIRVGDWVLAIGNPFGLGGSVSAGIISAKSRDIAAGPYDNFIQTDASINQGSSGGPMFNMKGEVIGINTALFSNSGASTGVGFAVPINLAGWIAGQLEETGEVRRGWIGVSIQPVTRRVARDVNLKDWQGVLVTSVIENSPAEKAGIIAGDIILNIGEHEIQNTNDFSIIVAETPAGTNLDLLIWRNEEVATAKVKVENPNQTANPHKIEKVAETPKAENDKIVKETGIKLRELSPELLKYFNLSPLTMGLVVEGVEANSDAAKMGVKKGDVVLKIDRKDVVTLDAAYSYIQEARMENNRPVMLLLQNQELGRVNVVYIKLKDNE